MTRPATRLVGSIQQTGLDLSREDPKWSSQQGDCGRLKSRDGEQPKLVRGWSHLRNRDAGLIIFDEEAAQYYEEVFLHDWQFMAQAGPLDASIDSRAALAATARPAVSALNMMTAAAAPRRRRADSGPAKRPWKRPYSTRVPGGLAQTWTRQRRALPVGR